MNTEDVIMIFAPRSTSEKRWRKAPPSRASRSARCSARPPTAPGFHDASCPCGPHFTAGRGPDSVQKNKISLIFDGKFNLIVVEPPPTHPPKKESRPPQCTLRARRRGCGCAQAHPERPRFKKMLCSLRPDRRTTAVRFENIDAYLNI